MTMSPQHTCTCGNAELVNMTLFMYTYLQYRYIPSLKYQTIAYAESQYTPSLSPQTLDHVTWQYYLRHLHTFNI